MIGAYVRIDGHDPQRAIVLDMDGWRARVQVIGFRPFVEYGVYPPQTHATDTGWVAKSRLYGFRSTRISEGVHACNIAPKPAEVVNGKKVHKKREKRPEDAR